MPVHYVEGEGWINGHRGHGHKFYPNREDAVRQSIAIRLSEERRGKKGGTRKRRDKLRDYHALNHASIKKTNRRSH